MNGKRLIFFYASLLSCSLIGLQVCAMESESEVANFILKKSVQLLACVKKNDLNGAQGAIASGANVNICLEFEERTPLTEAILQENPNMVELLLCSGADPDLIDSKGESPLVSAVFIHDILFATMLSERGADLNKTPKKGCGPLVTAVAFGAPITVKLLLYLGALVDNGTDPRRLREWQLRTLFAPQNKVLIDDVSKTLDGLLLEEEKSFFIIKRNRLLRGSPTLFTKKHTNSAFEDVLFFIKN